MRRIGTRHTTALFVTILLGALGGALPLAGAATVDKEQIHLTAAGQTAARAAVMQRADLGAATGWTGGPKKPDLSPGTGCANFNPKQSDLVLIGAAKTVFKHTGVEFDSEAQVLQTPAMVRLDWQRTVLSPQVLPCARSNFQKHLTTSERLVSARRLAFPAVATYSRAYRIIVAVTSGSTTVRIFVDLVLMGRGSTEITLTTTAPLVAEAAVRAAEVRLARTLVARAT
jgi:hypothetical protein